MTPSQVADVEGLLISLGLAATLAAAIGMLVPPLRRGLSAALGGSMTYLAAGIALLAMFGSLWFSEVAGFPPCLLCWWQRYAMYPLPFILGAAAVLDSGRLRIAGLVVACAGLAVSIYHNVIETFDGLIKGTCDPTNPCTIRWVEGLGFFTIPRMAAACFVMIIAFTLFDHLTARSPQPEQPADPTMEAAR